MTASAQLRVRFSGLLRRPAGLGMEAEVPVPAAATVASLLDALGYTPREQRFIRVLREGAAVGHDATLTAGTTVDLFILVGGG